MGIVVCDMVYDDDMSEILNVEGKKKTKLNPPIKRKKKEEKGGKKRKKEKKVGNYNLLLSKDEHNKLTKKN